MSFLIRLDPVFHRSFFGEPPGDRVVRERLRCEGHDHYDRDLAALPNRLSHSLWSVLRGEAGLLFAHSGHAGWRVPYLRDVTEDVSRAAGLVARCRWIV